MAASFNVTPFNYNVLNQAVDKTLLYNVTNKQTIWCNSFYVGTQEPIFRETTVVVTAPTHGPWPPDSYPTKPFFTRYIS
jgi:hypothetical protein